MKIILQAVGIISLFWAGTAFSQPLTFRSLGSTSTSADVRKAFPQVHPQNYCRNGETVQRNAEGETLCAQLALENYVLDNTSFDLTFVFNPDGKLRYVSLLKLYGTFRTDEGSVSAGTINSTFNSLADLISSKYGPAVADPPSSYLRRGPADSEFEWQPGRGTKWQSGGDRISLKSEGTESKTTPGLFRASIQIFYSFAKRDQFGNV